VSPRDATPALAVEGVSHAFGNELVLRDIDLEIARGEFVTLLGPSGCGKTTMLRIVAGLLRPTTGRIVLSGEDITHVPAHKRAVNMVFQRPTLFPHLDVFENVAFGLRIARLPKAEIERRVREALEVVRLSGFERRRSNELSGGQMQRIALARAIVNRPALLLLDEPLSALDLKIRLEMQVELRRVHRELEATFIYVTHDQGEALALSDRIAVFESGHIDQIATPAELYRRPATPFAARFVGDANVLACEVIEDADGRCRARLGDAGVIVNAPPGGHRGASWLVVRPESIRFAELASATDRELAGVVRDVAFRGTVYSYRVEVRGLSDVVKAEIPADAFDGAGVGSEVALRWERDAAVLLPRTESPGARSSGQVDGTHHAPRRDPADPSPMARAGVGNEEERVGDE
jgi:spermidine/putrescine transport system ATP-binding protein